MESDDAPRLLVPSDHPNGLHLESPGHVSKKGLQPDDFYSPGDVVYNSQSSLRRKSRSALCHGSRASRGLAVSGRKCLSLGDEESGSGRGQERLEACPTSPFLNRYDTTLIRWWTPNRWGMLEEYCPGNLGWWMIFLDQSSTSLLRLKRRGFKLFKQQKWKGQQILDDVATDVKVDCDRHVGQYNNPGPLILAWLAP